jgi:iron(III) transport system ATP-binding protein
MIEVRNLSRRFFHGTVISGVSFLVPDRCSVAILGASGSGKTTLLRLIAGLDTPDSGEILIDGVIASTPKGVVPPHRRNIGFVFQSPALWPHMTVEENILFALGNYGDGDSRDRLNNVLEQVSLLHLRHRYPHQISGGEARRVALARAIAPEPRCLLLDEPLTNLDTDLKEEMLALIGYTAEACGSSMIYVTHDLAEAERLADTILRLESGCIVPFYEGGSRLRANNLHQNGC